MKKFKKIEKGLITQLLLSVLMVALGVVVIVFKSFGLNEILLYSSILFYVVAFLSIICYFTGRREKDYEMLMFALINIVVATVLFVFKNSDMNILLGAAITIYSILIIINRCVKILNLRKKESFMWVVKFVVTFLIGILGMLSSINLYTEETVQTLMLGYYFMSLGFLMTLENLIELFVTEGKLKKMLKGLMYEDNKLEEIKAEVKPVVKKVKKEIKKTSKKVNKKVEKEIKPAVKKVVKKVNTEVKPKVKEAAKKAEVKIETEIKPAVKKEVKKVKEKVNKEVKPAVKKEVKKVKEKVNKEVKPKVKEAAKKAEVKIKNEVKPAVKKEVKKVKEKVNKEVKPKVKEAAKKAEVRIKKETKPTEKKETKKVEVKKPIKKSTKKVATPVAKKAVKPAVKKETNKKTSAAKKTNTKNYRKK